MRGAMMRAVRQLDTHSSQQRELQTSAEPVFIIELNDYISLTFDFNFGDGQRELFFGVQFHYDCDDSLLDS